jgi:hypothetical protein
VLTNFSGCDINTPQQPGFNGETPDICKSLESPLHLGKDNDRKYSNRWHLSLATVASQWGLERIVSALIEHHAEINKKVCQRDWSPIAMKATF